jgi:hypothetical protein
MWTLVSGLGTAILERALVEMQFVQGATTAASQMVYNCLFGTVYHKYNNMVDWLASCIKSKGGASIQATDAVPCKSTQRSDFIAERGRFSASGLVALDSQPSLVSSCKED